MDSFYVVLISVFLTSAISGVLGMLGGMILMTILLQYFEPQVAICIQGVIQLLANYQRYYQLREYVNKQVLILYLVGSLVAYASLRSFLFIPESYMIYALMSLVAFLGALRIKLPFSLKSYSVCLLSGLVVTAMQVAGVVGPILDFIFQSDRYSRHEVVGTKAGMISVTHFLKVVYMVELMGVTKTMDRLPLALICSSLVFSVLGTLLGKSILDRVTDKFFYKATSFALFILSLVYAWSFIKTI